MIPAEYRREPGLEPGDEVIIRLEECELRILTRAVAVRCEQALLEELSAERREEARGE